MIAGEIRWGTGFDNVISFDYPQGLDNTRTWRRPAPGSREIRNPAGVSDAWINKRDFMLAGRARHFSGQAWGGCGLQDFLDYATAKGTFRFLPDARYPSFYVDNCYLESPFAEPAPDLEDQTGFQSIDITIRQQAFDFNLAKRGLMFEYVPGKSLTDPAAATFSRADIAAFIGRDQFIAQAAAGTLRDRHFVSGLRTTLLEGAFVNGALQSESFGTSPWSVSNTTVQAATVLGPDNATLVDKLKEDNVNAVHALLQNVSPTLTDNAVYCYSVYLKAAERSWALVQFLNKAGAFCYTYINLATGALGTNAGIADALCYPMGNGWWRCFIAASAGVGATAPRIYVYVALGDTLAGYLGTTGNGIYLYGAQLELGYAPRAYKKTTVATVAVVDDRLALPFAFPVPMSMTCYVKFVELGTMSLTGAIGLVHTGTAAGNAPYFVIYNPQYNGPYRAYHHNGSAAVFSAALTSPRPLDIVEICATLFPDGSVGISQSINGGAVASGVTSAANSPLPSAWSSTNTIRLNENGPGGIGINGFNAVKIAPGVRTMAEMRVA